MSADEQGNDLGAVGVPITGLAAFAPLDAGNVIAKADLGASPLVLPPAAKRLGLYKQDGGPQQGRETGEPIEFFQIGYMLAGEGSRSITIGLAEQNATVQRLIEGAEPDEHGVIEVSSSLPDNRFILYTMLRYRNKTEKRSEGVASVTAVELDQSERGSVEGASVTFTFHEHELFNNAPFWQWGPAVPGAPVSATGVLPGSPGSFVPETASAPATIAALRALGPLGQTAAWASGQYVEYGAGQKAHWNGTDWATGEAS